jgi:predicted nucleic acid-binding protein
MARLSSKRIVRRWNASGSEGRLKRLTPHHPCPDRASRFVAQALRGSPYFHGSLQRGGHRRCGDAWAAAVSKADWIRVSPVQDVESLAKTITKTGLGAGEISAVFLAKELAVDLILMDEWKGRRLAMEEGLAVVGCIGILEELHRCGDVADLRHAYQELLRQNIRVDLRTLQDSLKQFGLASL